MLRLIATEARRFLHRRIFIFGFVGVVIIIGLSLTGAYISNAPPTAADIAQAEQWVQDEQAYLAPGGECEQEAQAVGLTYEENCTGWEPATVDQYLENPDFSEFGPGNQQALSAVVLFFLLAIGISFITAEISSGSLSNWLTFAPQRLRVYFSKAIVLTVMGAVITAILESIIIGGLRIVAGARNVLGPNSAQTLESMIQAGGRTIVLGVLFVLIGYAVGLIARQAAVAMGAVVLYVIVDATAANMLSNGWRFTVIPHVQAWLSGEFYYWNETACSVVEVGTSSVMEGSGEACDPMQLVLTQVDGFWFLFILTAALVTIGAIVMKRRDAA